ncbi:hypothetical protein [Streptococcus suis]|uniref:hypothetical protein n=1 Tax=Streptococcus suis TaxID=1307 RepID=UPI001F1BD55D|nr:hypothetical protein [Streptococcus suis]
MIKKIKILAVTFGIVLMVAPVVNAATAITYNGTGIWSWSSVSSWTNNSNSRRYTVNHNQSLTQTSSGTLSVRIMKNNWLGASIVSQNSFSGNTSGSFSAYLDSGTYYLRFESGQALYKFNINGSVTY